MKKIIAIALMCVLCSMLFASCKDGTTPDTPPSGPNTPVSGVLVESLAASVTIKDVQVADYDYTGLFKITEDGVSITVPANSIDKNEVKAEPGEYIVYCTYGGKEATITVNVVKTVNTLTLSQDSIVLSQEEAVNYDFSALFSATTDGQAVAITDDMIVSNVENKAGIYEYTVTFAGISRTLEITINPNHWVEAIAAYRELPLSLDEIENFDFTSLFSLFVDGVPVRVTNDMIDATKLSGAKVGNTYTVTFRYTYDGNVCESEVDIRVIEAQQLSIKAKNIVTYPNGAAIDLASLFEIKKGDTVIEAPVRYITGAIDYTKEGIYSITLNYPDHEPVVAQVEVKGGVVIIAPEKVTVRRGTSLSDYPFENDVTVIINGVRFQQIPITCFDLSNVDFNTAGDYPVTLTIRYNKTALSGLSGTAKYEDVTKTIIYSVTENAYEISVKSPSLLLGVGNTSYNVFNNLSVRINGRNQTLTNNPAHVDAISCYAKLLSDPIDYDSVADQEVRIAVYVNGPDKEPVIVTYSLRVEADISITADGACVFVNSPMLVKDLFTITEGGKTIPVSYDMISGKVDVFTPGKYTVQLVYRGIHCEATVVVLDGVMIGTYHTKLTTIGSSDSESGDGYLEEGQSSKQLGDLIIEADGTVKWQGKVCPIVSAVDEHTFTIKHYSFAHIVHYEDGIITLNPDDASRLSYGNEKRPAVYFHDRDWTVEKRFIVNQTSAYVLDSATSIHYSIDLFRLVSKHNGEVMWYGQKVNLVSKNSSDTIYINTWGVVTVGDGFETAITGDVADITFDGQTYTFTLLSAKEGKINSEDDVNKVWANKTFTGTIDGKSAKIQVNPYGQYTLWIGDEKIFATDIQAFYRMKYGGVDEANSTLLLYDYGSKDFPPYSYQFVIDTASNTFTYVPKDNMFGMYEYGNMYIFLNGYGKGVISFDTKSYSVTQLSYELIGQELHITYLDTLPTFTHGNGAVLYTHPLGNLLTTKSFADVCEVGATWRNSIIVDGAIVDMSTLQIGAHANAKDDFYKKITITTKDGVMTDAQKKSCLTTNAIKWTAPGFYRFAVNISVGGETVTSYYTVQILASLADSAPIAQTFGQGVLFQNNRFSLDLYGRMTMNIAGVTYSGLATFDDGNTAFHGRAYNDDGNMINIHGNMLHDGVLKVVVSGGANFTEIYTTGTSYVSGGDGVVLRAYTVSGKTYYRLASSLSAVGEEATITCLNTNTPFAVGAILEVKTDSRTVYVRIEGWDDKSHGLTPADSWRGTYTAEGKDNLVLDGFGKITLGNTTGSYRQNGKWIVAKFGELRGFILNTESMTYTEEALPFNADSFVGMTYSATYNFVCDDMVYSAETSFEFLAGGVVNIISTSSSHDSECSVDTYNPIFTTTENRVATYTLTADMLTVTVGNTYFTFYVDDVIYLNQIALKSTNLSSDAHGYIPVDTVLSAK